MKQNKNNTTKSKNRLSKIDTAMLEAADKIHKNMIGGVCKNLYAAQINSDNYKLVSRLEGYGYIRVIYHPNRRGNAYEWLHDQLRPYQVFMKQLVIKSKDDFVIAALPTGTGKTKTALALIQEYKRTLFVTPRINLSAQTHSVFGESLEVGLMQGSNTKNLSAPHIIANLQTLERRLDDLPEFDLIVWDEIHYSFDRIEKLIARLPGKHVGLSATPYYADGTPLPAKIIEPFDVRYFIDKKYLATLKCLQTVLVDDKRLKRSSTGDFTEKSIDEITKDDVFNRNIIDATKDSIVGQALVFAANISHCEKLAKAYVNAGFKVLVMHSDMKDPQQALQDFKDNKAQLLITVNQVSFGTDVPAVETGIVARPIGSKSLWRQVVGRLLRTAPGKKGALLLDCGGNLKRLGNPLTKARPPEERTLILKPECKECGYPKAPYLKGFSQNFDIITRIYKCASCGFEEESQTEVDTVPCDKCNRYYLSTDCIIHNGSEVLRCACGHTTIVNELDDLKLILADDELLQHKLKSAITKADGESNMLEVVGASLSVMKAIDSGLFERDTILLMLERGDLLSVAEIIQRKTRAIEQTAQKTHDAEIRVQVTKEFEAKQAKRARKAKQAQAAQPKSGIQQLLESTSDRYKQQGKGGLSDSQVKKFMRGYDRCELGHKEHAVKVRIGNIENAGQPISYLMNFIEYIETHQRQSQ